MIDDPKPLPCHEKLAFSTRKEAQATVIVVAHRYGTKVKVYTCRFCHLWHLSSQPE